MNGKSPMSVRLTLLAVLAGAGLAAADSARAAPADEPGLIASLVDETPLLPPGARAKANLLYPKLQSPDPAVVDAALAELKEAGTADGRYLVLLQELTEAIAVHRASSAEVVRLEDRLKTTFDTARGPGDLERLISALEEAKAKADKTPATAAESVTFEQLGNLAIRWQAYLMLVQSNNPAGANQVLNDLANDPNAVAYYPRTRILQRQVAKLPQTPGPDLDPVRTYRLIEPQRLSSDNLDVLISELGESEARNSPMMEDLPDALDNLRQEMLQLTLGSGQKALSDSTYFERESHHFGPYAGRIPEIYHAHKLKAVAVQVHAGPELQPLPEETTQAYLLRIFAANKTAKNWDQVSRAVNTTPFAVLPDILTTPSPLTRVLRGYRFFLAGQRYETMGRWELAARAYADALAVDESTLPRGAFKESLDAVKAAHPAETARVTGPDPGAFEQEIQGGGLYIPHHSS